MQWKQAKLLLTVATFKNMHMCVLDKNAQMLWPPNWGRDMKRSIHSLSALHETCESKESWQTNLFLLGENEENKQTKPLIQIYLDFKFLNGIFTDYWNGSQLNFFKLYSILTEYIYVTGTKTIFSQASFRKLYAKHFRNVSLLLKYLSFQTQNIGYIQIKYFTQF